MKETPLYFLAGRHPKGHSGDIIPWRRLTRGEFLSQLLNPPLLLLLLYPHFFPLLLADCFDFPLFFLFLPFACFFSFGLLLSHQFLLQSILVLNFLLALEELLSLFDFATLGFLVVRLHFLHVADVRHKLVNHLGVLLILLLVHRIILTEQTEHVYTLDQIPLQGLLILSKRINHMLAD